MRNLLILCASVAISASACAEATSSSSPTTAITPASSSTIATPNVPSDAPYIVLSANHDEPNSYGFCMDTYGPGQTDLMQTHSCKPAKADAARDYAGHDTRFEYNPETQQVMSYPFEGLYAGLNRERCHSLRSFDPVSYTHLTLPTKA